jgi:cell division septum initiation protein DivIVA
MDAFPLTEAVIGNDAAELERLRSENEALRLECERLKLRLDTDHQQLQSVLADYKELKKVEIELREVLVSAQKMSNTLVVNAYREAEMILQSARDEAVKEVSKAHVSPAQYAAPVHESFPDIVDLDALYDHGTVHLAVISHKENASG